MKNIELNYFDAMHHVTKDELDSALVANQGYLAELQNFLLHRDTPLYQQFSDSIGWLQVEEWADEAVIEHLWSRAGQIRQDADVFVIVGVGGSNQAARAVIEALQQDKKVKILYAGNNISAHGMNALLEELEGKSVYVNVIAKNFETLEPGIGFRVLRDYLEKRYGAKANRRIIATGTIEGTLHQLAKEQEYDFLTFPSNVGGRYSSLTEVGLFPMAVGGIDIRVLVSGAKAMQQQLSETTGSENVAFLYSTYRNLLLKKGYQIEMMAFFEPQFYYLSKWWIQLFAESEGKEDKGIFPVSVSYSEDLHSIGQYVQDGQKILFETFLDIEEQNSSISLTNPYLDDHFGYLDGKDFWEINKVAMEATIGAHSSSGIPCLKLMLPALNEYYFGQLFYFFEFACCISGRILGVDPFDQPGVEKYKVDMFGKLGKDKER